MKKENMREEGVLELVTVAGTSLLVCCQDDVGIKIEKDFFFWHFKVLVKVHSALT